MNKKVDKQEIRIAILFWGFVFWFIASFFEISAHNLERGYKYSKFNLINILFTQVHASEHMAIHEEQKGTAQAQYIEDLDYLAQIIYAEGGQANYVSDKCCAYIGSVVLNRVQSDIYPNTIKEVVLQSGQYSTVHSKWFYQKPNERSYEIAEYLLHEGSELPSGVLFQANFSQGSGEYENVDGVSFCWR